MKHQYRLKELRARFVQAWFNIEGEMYICHHITENLVYDYVKLWLYKPFSANFVPKYFLISVVTDSLITELFDLVMHQEDCSYMGKFYTGDEREFNE